ncbi:dynamin family protein [Flavobacterium caseinilyticum]|uniref:Dynamin N-terminal domain-containing protein n=1 Tax=Flavobacterium caseinilyticum TaxID=2541732 RepID=A0A4R5AQZ9_9FLAO|nr:dynamin family protein [Flavobacterium caseinilyticum]TDD74625.1 hypothetical protein E0F89_14050 [Flavobacterium caseinilyticum]
MAIFKRKKDSESIPSGPSFIKIENIYLESTTKALELIGQLNGGTRIKGVDAEFTEIDSYFTKKNKEQEAGSIRQILTDNGFGEYIQDIQNSINDVKLELSSNVDDEFATIAVAGAFSAGKSSFLNSILFGDAEKEILPSGQKPTSVVPTYLYCGKVSELSIQAENNSENMVAIDKNVLAAIGHDFETRHKIQLSSFLKRLYLNVPTVSALADIAFIDTPGYDKAEKTDQRSTQTDRETAEAELKRGDALFWLIDIERGSLTRDDKEFITKFDKKKPKVIIINKADKKDLVSIREVVHRVAKDLKTDDDNTIIDVIAYSSHKKQVLYSYRKKYMDTIYGEIKQFAKKSNAESQCVEYLEKMLDFIIISYINPKIKLHDTEIQTINRLLNQSIKDGSPKDEQEYFRNRKNVLLAEGDYLFNDKKIAEKEFSNLIDDLKTKVRNIRRNKSTQSRVDVKSSVSAGNVFIAIKTANHDNFLNCFAHDNGVDQYEKFDNYTPLTAAIYEGNLEMVRFFDNQGADFTTPDDHNRNAMESAKHFGYRNIISFLEEKGY